MPRRISSGKVGRNVLGDIFAQDNSIRSVVDNENVVLQASGTGVAVSATDFQINEGNSLRLADGDSSNYVALTAPATVASNVTFTLPSTDGTANQTLVTDGSGNLSFANNFLAVQNRTTADSNTYYITMSDQTSGNEDTLSIVDGSRFFYTPNANTGTGKLTVGNIDITSSTTSSSTSTGALVVTGGVGIGGQMTAVSIVETSSIALKENIEPIQNGLDSILRLTGVTYDRKDNGEHESGLIAEWVEEVLPELVTRDADGAVVGIKYTKLTSYLIEAIKSLKTEIDELKNK